MSNNILFPTLCKISIKVRHYSRNEHERRRKKNHCTHRTYTEIRERVQNIKTSISGSQYKMEDLEHLLYGHREFIPYVQNASSWRSTEICQNSFHIANNRIG